MWSTIAFSLCLMVLSAFLIWTHLRAWRTAATEQTEQRVRQFHRHQLRRRTLSSAIIGLIGTWLLASPLMINPTRLVFWFYWSIVLAAVVAIGLLALVDLFRTQAYFRMLQNAGLVEQLALHARLARLRSHKANGDHRSAPN